MYTLMLPPMEQRFVCSPMWARDRGNERGKPLAVRLADALADTPRPARREEMVIEHLEVLSGWMEIAMDLLEESAAGDPRCEEIGLALVSFAGDLGRALGPGGTAGELEPGLCLEAVAAITGAMVVASDCLACSFSRQTSSTG